MVDRVDLKMPSVNGRIYYDGKCSDAVFTFLVPHHLKKAMWMGVGAAIGAVVIKKIILHPKVKQFTKEMIGTISNEVRELVTGKRFYASDNEEHLHRGLWLTLTTVSKTLGWLGLVYIVYDVVFNDYGSSYYMNKGLLTKLFGFKLISSIGNHWKQAVDIGLCVVAPIGLCIYNQMLNIPTIQTEFQKYIADTK